MPSRKCHIASAWPHPDYSQARHRLVLTYDPNATGSKIVLDEAAEAKDGAGTGVLARDQLWEIEQQVVGDKYYTLIKSRHKADYLTRQGTALTLQPKPADQNSVNSDQVWEIGHVGDHDLVLSPPDSNKTQSALTALYAPTMQSGTLVTEAVTLTPLTPAADLNNTQKSWKIIPADGFASSAFEKIRTLQTHVPDQCDGTWHNPACPGNSATWTGCSYDSVNHVCNCSHA